MLRQVLERIRAEAAKRPIRVCTHGPCTLEVAREAWLERRDARPLDPRGLAVFHAGARTGRSP
jgi:hypothetical protein